MGRGRWGVVEVERRIVAVLEAAVAVAVLAGGVVAVCGGVLVVGLFLGGHGRAGEPCGCRGERGPGDHRSGEQRPWSLAEQLVGGQPAVETLGGADGAAGVEGQVAVAGWFYEMCGERSHQFSGSAAHR
jgi:hypothetical protein